VNETAAFGCKLLGWLALVALTFIVATKTSQGLREWRVGLLI
jgi:hypothetical protein